MQKQTYLWDEIGLITRYYSALKTLCIPVDIIGEDRDLSIYPVVIAPAYQMVDRELIEKWRVDILPTSPSFLNLLLLSKAY